MVLNRSITWLKGIIKSLECWFPNLLSCSWLVMRTLFPSWSWPAGRLLPALRTCLKVMSLWPLRTALLCLFFLSVMEIITKVLVISKQVVNLLHSFLVNRYKRKSFCNCIKDYLCGSRACSYIQSNWSETNDLIKDIYPTHTWKWIETRPCWSAGCRVRAGSSAALHL